MVRGWIAFSGGLDSLVLTHFLRHQFSHLSLQAIHINHQLHPEANAWALHCEKICATWKIPFIQKTLHIQRRKKESLEAAARRLRYAAFASYLQAGDLLITAHHQDDQAETVLLQLLRGAGLRGCAAMPAIQPFAQGYLLRPLLSFSRTQLQNYAQFYGLQWIEDPSNADTRFDRNFLRHTVLPLLKTHWPQANQTLARFARHCAEQNALLEQLATEDLHACQGRWPDSLDITRLQQFSEARWQNILRQWLRQRHLPIPPQHYFRILAQEVFNARIDANPVLRWPGVQCRRFQKHLFILPDPLPPRSPHLTTEEKIWCDMHVPNLDLQGSKIHIAFRQGQEAFKYHQHAPHRLLKKLMQEWKIPPWERSRIPLIFFNQELIAVVGYACYQSFKE